MIAFLEARRAGLLSRQHWVPNIIAGIIVGVVALPLAMAFAIASGVKPEQGIYTAIVAGIAVSVFGGSRLQIAGPTGAFIVILADIVARHGVDGLQIATIMAGIILLVLGVSRMGVVIKFIPVPVIMGFTAGIGVIIWVGQWQYFLGLPDVGGGQFHQKLWALLQVLPQLDPATTFIGFVSLGLVIFSRRIKWLVRVPGPLVALVLATLLQSILGFSTVATIGSTFGEIPRGLPSFQLPDLNLSRMVDLLGPAFAIAMLGAIESLLSAVVADRMAGTRHHSNQELIGQGIANIAAPLFGGFAATGAIARTATNIRNGGNSPLAGIVHALTLVLILLVFAPLASNIPLATLAAILFVVAWNMSEARHVVLMLKKAPRSDVVILVTTFLLTVFSDLVVAVNIGVVMAMLHFLRRMAESVKVRQQDPHELSREFALDDLGPPPEGLRVYTVEGPFFFGAADIIGDILQEAQSNQKALLLRMRYVPYVDGTGLQALEDLLTRARRHHIRVLISEANPDVLRNIRKMGLMDNNDICASVRDAYRRVAALSDPNPATGPSS